jgi:hypothetical protein
MNKDRYQFLGAKTRVRSFDEALVAVRVVWPGAFVEGSTGAERTFFVRSGGDLGLVAHCWPVRGAEEAMHLRVLDAAKSPVLDSEMPSG